MVTFASQIMNLNYRQACGIIGGRAYGHLCCDEETFDKRQVGKSWDVEAAAISRLESGGEIAGPDGLMVRLKTRALSEADLAAAFERVGLAKGSGKAAFGDMAVVMPLQSKESDSDADVERLILAEVAPWLGYENLAMLKEDFDRGGFDTWPLLGELVQACDQPRGLRHADLFRRLRYAGLQPGWEGALLKRSKAGPKVAVR
jgi:hypothetical protein